MLLFEPAGILQYVEDIAFGFGKSIAKPISNVSSQVKDTGYTGTATGALNTYDKPDTVQNAQTKSILSSPAEVKTKNFFGTILESIGVTDTSKQVSTIERGTGITQTDPSPSSGLTKTIADVFGKMQENFLSAFNVTTKGVTTQNKASSVSNVTAFPSVKTSAEIMYNPASSPSTDVSGYEKTAVLQPVIMQSAGSNVNYTPILIIGIIAVSAVLILKGGK